ncbi:MAG: lytic transglycosylase domain-containing protein [Rhodobacteraceae bacterium]|nr:lytic transglycosylase domain-containing protein [Paracoccaceae bacterium]
MKKAFRLHSRPHARRLISVLLLSIAPVLHAGERAVDSAASPYRLVIRSDRGFTPDSAPAPYQLDPRYRLGSAATEKRLSEKPYAREIAAAARDAGLDPALVHALIAVESAYQPSAVSPKGAVGLMQLLPETAQRYGVSDPAGVEANLRAGTRHLRGLMEMFDDRVDLVLAAYNAGEGAVKRYNNSIPPYPETRQYVPAVIDRYQASSGRPVRRSAVRRPLPALHVYLPGTRLESQALARR